MLLLAVTVYRCLSVEKYWYMEYNADYSEFVISFSTKGVILCLMTSRMIFIMTRHISVVP